MDPSTHSQSSSSYTAFSSSEVHQNQIPPQRSRALLGCGLALILTSILCQIPLAILLCMPTSNVALAWYVFNAFHHLMAMNCVYDECNVAECSTLRYFSIMSTMIVGIVANVGTFPIVIGYFFAFAYNHPFTASATEVTVFLSSALSVINMSLSNAIIIMSGRKTRQLCNPPFHPTYSQRLTSNAA